MSEQREPNKRRLRVTRRGLLIGAGVAGAGLAIGVVFGRNSFYRALAGMMARGFRPGGADTDPTLWYEVLPSNVVRIIIPKVEMGQGIHTAMAQVGADELGASWEQVEVVQGGTGYGPQDSFGTTASLSIVATYQPMRQAAATLRQMLMLKAAEKLSVPVGQLEVIGGTVRSTVDGEPRLTFGDIVAGVTEWREPDDAPVLKSPAEFRLIGQPVPRVDLEAKLRGDATYAYDLRRPGMLYGAVARPPTIGATMLSARAGTADRAPGVVAVVIHEDKGFAGVAATTRHQAINALDRLEVSWDPGPAWSQDDIDGLLDVSDGAGAPIQMEGDPTGSIGDAPTLTAEYATPFAVHAHLEPQAALADIGVDSGEVLVSSQMALSARSVVADALGMDEAQVNVTPTYLGGAFGRKTGFEPALEAALLSRAVQRPVHVGWTRTEDMRHGYYRPPTRSRFAAKLEGGRILALTHNHSSGEVLFPFLPGGVSLLVGPDPGGWRGAYNFYSRIPNRQLNAHTAKLPVATGPWRGLGLLANVFATESFMDELAHAADTDPLQFRLDHLGDDAFAQRMGKVLNAAAERAGYGRARSSGHALGIACSVDVDTVAALCAEISLGESGRIIVHRATEAIDPGRLINPDGATAQVEGSIIMGLSSTLIEEMEIADGVVQPANFDQYPLLTMDRAPDIDVVLLESDGLPRGMGEPPLGPVAAAVGNAFFNLTGARLRVLPFSSARVRDALA